MSEFDELNVSAEQNPESQEYIDQMVAKAKAARGEQTETPAPTDTEEELIAGKFKTEEDRDKSILELLKKQKGDLTAFYKELEKDLGKPKEAPTDNKIPTDKPQDEKPQETPQETPQEKPKFDIHAMYEQYVQTGQMDETALQELEKIGITRDTINLHIQGQMAMVQLRTNEIYKEVGGEGNYTALVEWAKTNLTDGEKNIYNQAMGSPDLSEVMFAVEGLQAKYIKANGQPPKRLLQGSSSDNNLGAYKSRQELTAAMSDPRYASDPAYRAQVYDKMKNSNIFNHRSND